MQIGNLNEGKPGESSFFNLVLDIDELSTLEEQ